jgi:glycosyltransferase involved in cell wall biosynthesis
MRVSFLLRYFTIGGLERVVVSLANAYYSKGIDVDIIVVSKGKRNSLITELNPNIKINFLEGTFFNKIIELRRYTKGRLVHVNFGDGKIHPLLRCFIFDRLKIITYHSNYSHKRNKIKNLLDKWWFNNFKHIVAVSDSVKDFCLNEIKYPNNITVIKNAIQDEITNISKANWSSDKSVLKIVSLSSLYPHKNHKLLINSLGILKEKYPDVNVEISIIGDGPCLSELYQTSIKLGLNNIRWYGAIWDKKLVGNILQQSDLFISVSLYEGFPISILEAMRYGTPLLLSDIMPHIELAEEAASYFGKSDSLGLAHKIAEIFYNKAILNEMSKRSRKQIEKYNFIEMVNKYISIYTEVWEKKYGNASH